jgi:hypothetical protein
VITAGDIPSPGFASVMCICLRNRDSSIDHVLLVVHKGLLKACCNVESGIIRLFMLLFLSVASDPRQSLGAPFPLPKGGVLQELDWGVGQVGTSLPNCCLSMSHCAAQAACSRRREPCAHSQGCLDLASPDTDAPALQDAVTCAFVIYWDVMHTL